MATDSAHLKQAQDNLRFLLFVNQQQPFVFDWQVTIAFYAGVHLVNAHISKVGNMHFRSHVDVAAALNFAGVMPTRLPETQYLAYQKLYGLSRRARYLCHEQDATDREVRLTYAKHLARAVRNLDVLLVHMNQLHGFEFGINTIRCETLNGNGLVYFRAG